MKILKLQLKDLLIYIQKISLSNSTQNSVSLFAGTRNSLKNTAEKSQPALLNIFSNCFTQMESTLHPQIPKYFLEYALMSTNCFGERSFSLLARTKNVKRSTMSQDHLGVQALLCIKRELLHETDFISLIDEFATTKLRRIKIQFIRN